MMYCRYPAVPAANSSYKIFLSLLARWGSLNNVREFEMEFIYVRDAYLQLPKNMAGNATDLQTETQDEKSEKSNKLPLTRIKHIMKLDSDVTLASQDAVFIIAKATVNHRRETHILGLCL